MRFYYEALGLDPFHALPMTFHVKSGLEDPEFQRFKQQFENLSEFKSFLLPISDGAKINRTFLAFSSLKLR